jgi:hypothetical protein
MKKRLMKPFCGAIEQHQKFHLLLPNFRPNLLAVRTQPVGVLMIRRSNNIKFCSAVKYFHLTQITIKRKHLTTQKTQPISH